MTVLTLIVQVDLDQRVVEGNASANQPIELRRFNGPLCCYSNPLWSESPVEQTSITATVSGSYSATMALARPNYGLAIVTAADGNQTYARFAVPYLAVRMGSGYMQPIMFEGQVNDTAAPVTITIQGRSGYFKDIRSTTSASSGYVYDSGASVTLDSGDVITVVTEHQVQAALRLPSLTGEIDPVTDIVSGTAPPNTQLKVTLNTYESPVPYPTPTPYSPRWRRGFGTALHRHRDGHRTGSVSGEPARSDRFDQLILWAGQPVYTRRVTLSSAF